MKCWTTALLATAAMLAQTSVRPPIELLQTGTFHGGEVAARNGERWIGLAQAPAGFHWRRYRIAVRSAPDPLGEDAPSRMTGVSVTVRGAPPMLLLKGLDSLLAADIATGLYSPGGLELPNSPLELTCGPGCGAYSLTLSYRRKHDSDPQNPSQLILASNGVSQVLQVWPEGLLDQNCQLVWAGDLDGDKKLDLVMDLSDHYNVIETTLFLSSRSAAGELVKRVAAFRKVGC